jgi:threo-3-hydroxy-L-aspartate ammonia-lyase
MSEHDIRLELDDVRAAAARLKGVAHRTPVVTSGTLDATIGARVWLKAENLQRTGAFKFRGAYNRIASLPSGVRGVAAFSSGNHAQAVAMAAALHDLPAVIVMPDDAPDSKVAATRGYGAEVVFYDRYTEDRRVICEGIAAERGLAIVPPYDDLEVMAGQGTAALELLEQVDGIDLFVAPMSGGGLMAGCSTVVHSLLPDARIVGVEPAAMDDTRQSLLAAERIEVPVAPTIADGLQVPVPGELTFPINLRQVDEVVTVTDAQLVDAMVFAHERLKLVVEPSGAAGLAALLGGALVPPAGARVGVILSGGNIAATRFAELVAGR